MNTVLVDKALELPPNERVAFAELILASIDYEEEEVRQLWIKEVKERMNAAAEGKTDLLDFEALYHEASSKSTSPSFPIRFFSQHIMMKS
ncbi:MAG: antitoxin [Prosthecochloris sp.]|nr:antitoxin [Prosthecochloris sp.]